MPTCCQHGLVPQKSQVIDSTDVRFVTGGPSGEILPMWTLAASFVPETVPVPYQMRGLKRAPSKVPSSAIPKQMLGEQALVIVIVVLAMFEILILFLPFFFLSRLSLKKQPKFSVSPVPEHGIG